jgi:hypothetical protein
MEYKNYSISSSKGKFYLKEKQPTAGYIEVPYGSEGKTTFHKYVDSIKGLPKYLDVKEISYEGKTLKFLELTLLEGDDISNKISVPLKNQKGNYSDETKVLISSLDSLKLGEEVTITPKSTTTTSKTNGKEYKNLNLYINYVNINGDNGKGLSTGFIPYNDIPKLIEKIVAGDKVYDFTPQTEFYYEKLNGLIEKFKVGGGTNSAPKAENKVTDLRPQTDEETDNLPF